MRYYSSTAGAYTLATSCSDTATSMEVSSTAGMPSQYPFTLVVDVGTTAEEIVTVTNVAGTSLTVQRGQDGSPSQAHQAGAVVRHMATARDFREPQQHMVASANVHGVTSNVVGVDDAQTLRNKTFDASNVFPATPKSSLPADTVYTSGTQTLTGKTISGASNTLTNIPKSALPGDIYYGTSTTFPTTALSHREGGGLAFGPVISWASGDVVNDPAGSWAAGNPTRLTVKTAGKYVVTATINSTNTTAGGSTITILKNGTIVGGAQFDLSGTATVALGLAVNDYIEMSLSNAISSTVTVTRTLTMQQIA